MTVHSIRQTTYAKCVFQTVFYFRWKRKTLFLNQNYCRRRRLLRHCSFSMFSLFQRFSIRSLGRSASSVLCAVCGLIHIILVFFSAVVLLSTYFARVLVSAPLLFFIYSTECQPYQKKNLRISRVLIFSSTPTSQIKNSKPTTVIYLYSPCK